MTAARLDEIRETIEVLVGCRLRGGRVTLYKQLQELLAEVVKLRKEVEHQKSMVAVDWVEKYGKALHERDNLQIQLNLAATAVRNARDDAANEQNTPARLDEIRLALQNLSRGVYQHDLDLRGNGVASLVMKLLDHGQRFETGYESLRAEVERLTPKWQEGEPPETAYFTWREDCPFPVGLTHDFVDGKRIAVRFGPVSGSPHLPWGTARYSLIPKPTEG